MLDRAVTKEQVVRKLDRLAPENLAEVDQFIDFIQYRTGQSVATVQSSFSSSDHPAFGIWADRKDITETVEYAEELRQKIEQHKDAKSLN